jgi:hypothetical protein
MRDEYVTCAIAIVMLMFFMLFLIGWHEPMNGGV